MTQEEIPEPEVQVRRGQGRGLGEDEDGVLHPVHGERSQ